MLKALASAPMVLTSKVHALATSLEHAQHRHDTEENSVIIE